MIQEVITEAEEWLGSSGTLHESSTTAEWYTIAGISRAGLKDVEQVSAVHINWRKPLQSNEERWNGSLQTLILLRMGLVQLAKHCQMVRVVPEKRSQGRSAVILYFLGI